MNQTRITELDLFRGICLLGVFLSHFLYDLGALPGVTLPLPPLLQGLFRYGGVLFVLLSGVCVTLGSRSTRRGCIVLGCGLLVSAVTWAFDALAGSESAIVRFGILHLLGCAMLLYPLFRRLPNWALTVLGLGFVALGLYFERITVPCAWLFPLGLTAQGFYSGDYWPLLPNFGWFLLGAALGRRLYPARRPLLPALQGKAPFLSFCGRHSLLLYLLQQPVTIALIGLVGLLLR